MGFYKKLKDNESTNFSDEDRRIEEDYQKLFPKIARDFICRKDVEKMFGNIIAILEEEGENQIRSATPIRHALLLAREYRLNLKRPINNRKSYRDIDELSK